MGLTGSSSGKNAIDSGIIEVNENEYIVALAGNPNVGKSTVFNALTGMNQHTGNWPGKTVSTAVGRYEKDNMTYALVDLPGTYSLMAHSAEEEVARDFLCFGGACSTVVVCDATCLERNLNLVLQTIEITPNVIVCVNLMDEAKKKHIKVDILKLQEKLGVPVLGVSARKARTLDMLTKCLSENCKCTHVPGKENSLFKEGDIAATITAEYFPVKVTYLEAIEEAVALVEPRLRELLGGRFSSRWAALRLIDYDEELITSISKKIAIDIASDKEVLSALEKAWEQLLQKGITKQNIQDRIVSCIVLTAEDICNDVVITDKGCRRDMDRKLDRLLTSKATGIPIMLLLLCFIFWLTITGANYPSQLLSTALFKVQDWLVLLFNQMNAPQWLTGALIMGVYRVLAWVVSVMLPPMAIFFPLFTLLEDFGYLPRVAFNLDHFFKKASACGKQALTMCMGFGCNAAGVVGCRIIDSPRERLIAIVTNSLVPCNGRFPTLISIITMFFVGVAISPLQSFFSTIMLTGVIVLGVASTLLISRLLSKTILKGLPSSFTLELPPYRTPQFGKVIVRSIFDRTLFVLGRAAAVAAPAGLFIWLMANIVVGDMTLLSHCSQFLDPFARLLGLDGVILLAFILGFPANEIVVPIIIMAYMATGSIMDFQSLDELKTLLVANGWTWVTAVSTMLFCLMHWPCSTTCMTIKKETKSLKWTLLSVGIPTAMGIVVCFAFTSVVRLLGLG